MGADTVQKRKRVADLMNNSIQRVEQIKALKEYYVETFKAFEEWEASGYKGSCRDTLPYPEICMGMKCEAKTRSGKSCKNDGTNWGNGRCKYHGGASTGPVSKEGKKRVSMNAKKQSPRKVNKS